MKRPAILLFVLTAVFACGDWKSDLDRMIKTPPGQERDSLIANVATAAPGWREVYAQIRAISFSPADAGKPVLRQMRCMDGKDRPYVVYIPKGYDPAKPSPLFVWLHGGVSRADLNPDPLGSVKGGMWPAVADAQGWIMVFPYGQGGATWWDAVGMANIQDQIRAVKQAYNVDDDRVFMGGFSDGASASFLYAMVKPSDFAAFTALNGHMGVGALDGKLYTYATNFANTPVYAVTTDKDQLYPTRQMQPVIDMARKAGGNITYRELEGAHQFSYAAEELPRIAEFLSRHPRDPFPTRVLWETAVPEFGACRWLVIDSVAAGTPAAWHQDFNATLADDSITFGFLADDKFTGPGIKLGNIIADDNIAMRLKMLPGDILTKANLTTINTMDDLASFKATVKRGDPVEVVVNRKGKMTTLKATIPEPASYTIFKHDKPSAIVRAAFVSNRIDIEGSRLGAFRILVHPDMIRLDQNLIVTVNGQKRFDAKVTPSVEYMLKNFLENRDRKLLYVAEVKVEP